MSDEFDVPSRLKSRCRLGIVMWSYLGLLARDAKET